MRSAIWDGNVDLTAMRERWTETMGYLDGDLPCFPLDVNRPNRCRAANYGNAYQCDNHANREFDGAKFCFLHDPTRTWWNQRLGRTSRIVPTKAFP